MREQLKMEDFGFGYTAYFSQDGRNWKEHSKNPLYYDGDAISLFWSPVARRFICVAKSFQMPVSRRIPDHGGIILNMSRMNKIVSVDEENWFAIVEPGVTYRQMQDAMAERGFRINVPFGVPPDRSVLTSYLERDPVLAAPSFEYGNALIMDTEIILPTGELFRTGNWATGGKPGGPNGPIRTMISRLWSGAQGTLGIMTKMGIHIDPIPKMRKMFFLPFDDLWSGSTRPRLHRGRKSRGGSAARASGGAGAMRNLGFALQAPALESAAPTTGENTT